MRFFILHLLLITTTYDPILCRGTSATPQRASNATVSKPNQTINKGKELLANLIPEDYEKNLRPNFGGEKVDVNVSMFVKYFTDVNEKSMDFRGQIYLRNYWIDPRLAFSESTYNLTSIALTQELSQKIWLPDTIIANAKSMNEHKQAFSGNSAELVVVKSNGQVLYSKMIDFVADCYMNFRYFPFDYQACNIEVDSFAFSTRDIEYDWLWDGKTATVALSGKSRSALKLLGGITLNKKIHSLHSGNYSHLYAKMYLTRDYGSYLSQIYLPTSLLVVLSWVPLWLNQNEQSTRLNIALMLVLAITIQSSTYNASFPATSYMKLIDLYLLTCWLFIFIALVECFVVTYLGMQLNHPAFKARKDDSDEPAKVNVIDKWARWLIPAAFVVFVVGYFGFVSQINVYDLYED